MGTRGYKIVRYKGRYWVYYNHYDSYPENFGVKIVSRIPVDPAEYKAWLEKQRATYESRTAQLEKLLCITEERVQTILAPTKNAYPWESIDNVELLPSHCGEVSNDLFIEWIYIIDLDEEVFSINNSIFFDLCNIPRERWLEAFEGTEYSTTICPEASLSPITPKYFTDDAERDQYKEAYEGYNSSRLDRITYVPGIDIRRIVAVMLLECLLYPSSSQMWDFLPQWGSGDFAFRELAFAILSLAAGEYYLINLGDLSGNYQNVESSSGFLVNKSPDGKADIFPILGRGCHTPNNEPGSAPSESMYYFQDILISLVPPATLEKDTDAAIAKAVEFGLLGGKKDFEIVVFSIKSVIIVKVSVEGEMKSVKPTKVMPITLGPKRGAAGPSSVAFPTDGTDLPQQTHPGFAALQAIFGTEADAKLSNFNQGIFPTELYAEILSYTDPPTQLTCTKVSSTFHSLCQGQLTLSNDLTITKFEAAIHQPESKHLGQTLDVFGRFTFQSMKTGIASRSSFNPGFPSEPVKTSSRWSAVIGAGERKSILSQGFLGITFT
ncbi:hypothetical protein McanMca71_004805 [Microsporum canis]